MSAVPSLRSSPGAVKVMSNTSLITVAFKSLTVAGGNMSDPGFGTSVTWKLPAITDLWNDPVGANWESSLTVLLPQQIFQYE